MCEYMLTVIIHSIKNRGGRCADSALTSCNSGQGCCTDNMCLNTFCNYYLRGCLRPVSQTVPLRKYPDPMACLHPVNTSVQRFERFQITQFSLKFSNSVWVSVLARLTADSINSLKSCCCFSSLSLVVYDCHSLQRDINCTWNCCISNKTTPMTFLLIPLISMLTVEWVRLQLK